MTALDGGSSTARAAAALRQTVLRGELSPGTQLSEQQMAEGLGVSRNTLREAFRVLVAERLLEHLPHRGVFVRRLVPADVADIYRTRRVVECGALAGPPLGPALTAMEASVDAAQAAVRRRDWTAVGTADVEFHSAVTALAGSDRLDAMVRGLFAELRLAFQLAPSARALHLPYVSRNAEILALVQDRCPAQAARAMRSYLDEAEAQVLAAVGVA